VFFPKAQLPVRATNMPDSSGGSNGSAQHSSRTRLALKTKAKSLAKVRSAGTVPWLGFYRGPPNRSALPGKHCRINALDGVASSGWAGTNNRIRSFGVMVGLGGWVNLNFTVNYTTRHAKLSPIVTHQDCEAARRQTAGCGALGEHFHCRV
jgi:hypothetical protein